MIQTGKSEIRLGKLELEIMKVVWQQGSATVQEVLEEISKGRKCAYSTILTMMRKLEAKGYLAHEVRERTFVYKAQVSKGQVRQGVLGDVLERLFEGSPSLLLASLVEQKQINEEEMAEVRRVISEYGEKKRVIQ